MTNEENKKLEKFNKDILKASEETKSISDDLWEKNPKLLANEMEKFTKAAEAMSKFYDDNDVFDTRMKEIRNDLTNICEDVFQAKIDVLWDVVPTCVTTDSEASEKTTASTVKSAGYLKHSDIDPDIKKDIDDLKTAMHNLQKDVEKSLKIMLENFGEPK